jgi:hypothetical protein
MHSGYRIRSNTVMVAAPPDAPAAYVLWKDQDDSWRFDGPHVVAAIVLGTEELAAPAHLRTSQRCTASGRQYTQRDVEFTDHFDEWHFEVERWHYAPVAFLLMPADCAAWERILVPSTELAFSAEAAERIIAARNAQVAGQRAAEPSASAT